MEGEGEVYFSLSLSLLLLASSLVRWRGRGREGREFFPLHLPLPLLPYLSINLPTIEEECLYTHTHTLTHPQSPFDLYLQL